MQTRMPNRPPASQRQRCLNRQQARQAAEQYADEQDAKGAIETTWAQVRDWAENLFLENPAKASWGLQLLERRRAGRLRAETEERRKERREEEARRRRALESPHPARGCRCFEHPAGWCPELAEPRIPPLAVIGPNGFRPVEPVSERRAVLEARKWHEIPEWVEAIGGGLREVYEAVWAIDGDGGIGGLYDESLNRILTAQERLGERSLIHRYGLTAFLNLEPVQHHLRLDFEARLHRRHRQLLSTTEA